MLPYFTVIDSIWCLLLLGLGVFLVSFIKKKYKINSPLFIPLFYAKLIGLAIFIGISFTYTNLGDTFKYYQGSKLLYMVFLKSPWVYFKVIFSDNTYIHELLLNLYPYNAFQGDFSFLSMVKVVSLFNTICLNSFWAVSILFCYISFAGSWLMYIGFKKIATLTLFHSILILFFPSVLFWASGIMKDSFCYSLLGILFYLMTDFHQSIMIRSKFFKIGALITSMYLLFLIKWYILFAFLGAYFLMQITLLIRKKINVWQIILLSGFSVLIIVFMWYEIKYDYILTHRLILRVKDFHNWHFLMSNNSYSFGEMNYNVRTLIMYFPIAVFTTLFRPFLWEINNFFLSLSVIESTFFFTFFLVAVFKLRKSGIGKILKNPLLLWSIFFVLFLSYITGISSYSFGALSRYRIPIIPFYLFFLSSLYRSGD